MPTVSSGSDASNSFKKYKPMIFLTALLDSIEYPVIAIGCDEKITFLNSKIPPLLGKRDAQIFGKEFGKMFKLFSENGSRIENPFDRI